MGLEAIRDVFSNMQKFIEDKYSDGIDDISIFAISNPSIVYTNKDNIIGKFGWKLVCLCNDYNIEKEFVMDGYIKDHKNDYFIETLKYFLLDPSTLLALLKGSLKKIGVSEEDSFRKELLFLARIDHLKTEE